MYNTDEIIESREGAPVDDITIESEAMEQEVRPRLQLGHIVPDFRLLTIDGKTISPVDYKERKNLLILFFDVENRGDLEMLAVIKQRIPEIQEANGQVLAISSGGLDEIKQCVASMDLQFPVLCDCAKEAACSYCVAGSSMFVADKYGELKLVSAVSTETIDETLDAAISQMELAELECPECGVSTWPAF